MRTLGVAGLAMVLLGCREPAADGVGAASALTQSWAGFERCLIGAPLAAGERASSRLQALDLARSLTAPAAGAAPWPGACAAQLAEVRKEAEAVRATHPEVEPLLRELAILVSVGFKEGLTVGIPDVVVAGDAPQVDKLFAAAANAKIQPAAPVAPAVPTSVVALPAPLEPMAGVKLGRLSRAAVPDEVLMLWSTPVATSCRLHTPFEIGCRAMSGVWAASSAPISRATATSEEMYFDFGETAPERGLFTVEHKAIAPYPFGDDSHLFADGTLLGIEEGPKAKSLLLRRSPDGARTEKLTIPHAPKPWAAALAGDAVVSWEKASDGRGAIWLTEVSATGSLAAPLRLGEVGKWEDFSIARRRGPECDAIAVLQHDTSEAGAPIRHGIAASFRDDTGAWSPLVAIEFKVKESQGMFDLFETFPTLVCERGRLTFDYLSEGGLRGVTCSKESCKLEQSAPLSPASQADSRSLALRLGDKTLFVRSWTGPTDLFSFASAVAFRLAPHQQIAQADQRLLAIDKRHGGRSAFFSQVEGFVYEGRAYVFFADNDGATFAVSIAEDGAVTPLRMR